ncbi:MAG: HD domain-containing protein [Chloroflexota bacterium]|nr:MAG: HD domain-containing protein [Chloroflexota bacterium]
MSLWSRLPLAAKIAIPYVLLTLIVGGAGAFITARLVSESTDDRVVVALAQGARAAGLEFGRQEVARLSGLDGLVTAGDPLDPPTSAHLAALATRAGLDQTIDRAIVVASDGSTFAARREATGWRVDDSVRQATLPTITSALRGESDRLGERHAGLGSIAGESVFVVAAPLRRDGAIVGALALATGSERAAAGMRRAALGDVAITDDAGGVIATTMPGLTAGGFDGSVVATTIDDRPFRALAIPARLRDRDIGTIVVALPADVVEASGLVTRQVLAGLTALAMMLAAAIGLTLSRFIASPVGRLVGAARALGAGDLGARSRVHGGDEIGALGAAFDGMAASLEDRQRRLTEAYLNTVHALAAAVDAKDPYTNGHSQRVADYATRVARALALSPETIEHIEMGGLLHDVGKIGVPDHVLLKPGKLDDSEFALVKAHPAIGHEILMPVGFGQLVMDVVRSHHERIDGGGYPDGLAGDAVPMVARIVGVCDAYDTMTSRRAYHEPRDHATAVAELRRCAGTQFDPACVEALAVALPDGPLPDGVAQHSYEALREETRHYNSRP